MFAFRAPQSFERLVASGPRVSLDPCAWSPWSPFPNRHPFAEWLVVWQSLTFPSTGVINRHAPTKRRSRRRCGTGRAHCAGEDPRQEGGKPEEERAAAKKTANTKHRANAKGTTKEADKAKRKSAASCAESKGAKILNMVARAERTTLTEIMKAADRKAHSVCGFISTSGKKHCVRIESAKAEAGERTYKIAK